MASIEAKLRRREKLKERANPPKETKGLWVFPVFCMLAAMLIILIGLLRY